MNYKKSMRLMEKYCDCPKCGNEYIGNGQGGITVEDDTFRRWCKCGFDIIIDDNDVFDFEIEKVAQTFMNQMKIFNCNEEVAWNDYMHTLIKDQFTLEEVLNYIENIQILDKKE